MQTSAPTMPELQDPRDRAGLHSVQRMVRRCQWCDRRIRKSHPSVFCSTYCLDKYEAWLSRDRGSEGDERKLNLARVPKLWMWEVGLIINNCGFMRVRTQR